MAKDPASRYQSAGDLARAALAAVDRPSLAAACASSRPARARRAGAGRTAGAGVPLQGALQSELESGAFVGRTDALARLRARYERAAAGARQIVLLSRRARASASRGWPPSSRARRTPPARPSSTAATTPSRSSPTSRS